MNHRKAKELHLKRLQAARRKALGSLPPDVGQIVETLPSEPGWAGLRLWQAQVIEALLEVADKSPDPGIEYWGNLNRAFCPLCGSGATIAGRGTLGYAIPKGLSDHLGHRGRSLPCRVMDAVETPLRFPLLGTLG